MSPIWVEVSSADVLLDPVDGVSVVVLHLMCHSRPPGVEHELWPDLVWTLWVHVDEPPDAGPRVVEREAAVLAVAHAKEIAADQAAHAQQPTDEKKQLLYFLSRYILLAYCEHAVCRII